MKPRPTATKFTQAEVSAVVYLLYYPGTPPKHIRLEDWQRTIESLKDKFLRIDRRFPSGPRPKRQEPAR